MSTSFEIILIPLKTVNEVFSQVGVGITGYHTILYDMRDMAHNTDTIHQFCNNLYIARQS